MSDAETPVPPDTPLMKAWAAYKATEEFENSRRWAQLEAHVDGSMWAAFLAGWTAAGRGVIENPQ